MQYLIDMFGVSVVCMVASVIGGFCNYNVKKAKGKAPRGGHINWLMERKRARIEFLLSVFIAFQLNFLYRLSLINSDFI